MTWSVKDINKFIQHPLIHPLMTYDTQYNNREVEYIEHNYSSDTSSSWLDPLMLPHRRNRRRVAGVGHTGGLTNLHPWCGRCRAGYSNTGGPPLPRKRAPWTKKLENNRCDNPWQIPTYRKTYLTNWSSKKPSDQSEGGEPNKISWLKAP